MDETTWGPVRELLARTAGDAGLRERVMADPVAAIRDDAGVDLPEDWHLVGSVGASGSVELHFADDELPLAYLEVVGGTPSSAWSFPPHVGGYGSMGSPLQPPPQWR